MCVPVCMCRAGGSRGLYFYLTFAKIYASTKNMARLWAGLSFRTSPEGFSTRRGNAPSTFCSNSLLGFGEIPSLGLPWPVCKVRDMTYKRAFPQGLEKVHAPGFLSELQGVVSLRGPCT